MYFWMVLRYQLLWKENCASVSCKWTIEPWSECLFCNVAVTAWQHYKCGEHCGCNAIGLTRKMGCPWVFKGQLHDRIHSCSSQIDHQLPNCNSNWVFSKGQDSQPSIPWSHRIELCDGTQITLWCSKQDHVHGIPSELHEVSCVSQLPPLCLWATGFWWVLTNPWFPLRISFPFCCRFVYHVQIYLFLNI